MSNEASSKLNFDKTGLFVMGIIAKTKTTKGGKPMAFIVAGESMLPVLSDNADFAAGQTVNWPITIFPTNNGYMAQRIIE